jgi:hypothetical protein
MTVMTPTMKQTVLICKAHALQARHGAVDGVVRSSHEDVIVECHSRPCPGGGDVVHNEVWQMNASAINGVLFGGGRRTMLSSPAVCRWPWMDCLVRCLEMDYVKGDGCGGGGGNQGDAVGFEGDDGIPVVLRCLLSIASFAESKNAMMMGGGGGVVAWGSGGGCASSLLQSLSQLGFLLIDCIKKDKPYGKASSPSSSGIAAMGNGIATTQVTAVLAPCLNILSFGCIGDRNSISSSSALCAILPLGGSSCATSFANPCRHCCAFHHRCYTLCLLHRPTTMTSCRSWQSWMQRMPMTMNARHPAQPPCS